MSTFISLFNKKILLSLGVIAFAAALAVGATIAAFTASAEITSNTLATATVSITATGEGGAGFIAKPVAATNLIPGGVHANEYQARITNTSDVPLNLYMYLTAASGASCSKTKIAWQSTAAAGTPALFGYTTAPTLITDANFAFLSTLNTLAEKVQIGSAIAPGVSILVHQKVGLDTSATNANQGGCAWTETFYGETV